MNRAALPSPAGDPEPTSTSEEGPLETAGPLTGPRGCTLWGESGVGERRGQPVRVGVLVTGWKVLPGEGRRVRTPWSG